MFRREDDYHVCKLSVKCNMSQCKKFAPNIFHKTKCSNCFRQKEEHSAEALECNRASRSIARSGYLFVAPDWDFSVPLNRTKRWQRRWFVLYDDGELNYSVDEHPDTVPQGSVDMSKVLEVTGAEQVTGHPHSLALTSPDRVTFVKAASREDARWWAELLAVFPRRHKRNATFPGGRASPSLPQLGRSASPQPPRPRHLSVNGPSPRTNFETPPLKEERESPPKEETPRPVWLPEPTNVVPIEAPPSSERNEYIVSSGSPPTRDKLRCEDKARARRDWNWRTERFKDIATALTDRSPESSLALPAEGLLHLKKGWLWVKTASNEWFKKWVVVCGPTLSIYQDQDEQNIPETVVELSTVTNYNEVPTETKYGFEIHWSGPTLTMSAVTTGIRSNWLQALKKAAPISTPPPEPVDCIDSPLTPNTPKCLLSSDEEYKTASEGGRRGSEDWSELPPSPPLSRTSLSKVKDRSRLRPRLPRCQSRQSTLDSTSTDELESVKDSETVQLNNTINKQGVEIGDLQKQLAKATDDLRCMEEEIARLKELQSDAVIREKKAKEQLLNFERTERELNQRNIQTETKFLREQRSIQKRLLDAEESAKNYEERYNVLSRELLSKQRMVTSLQEELSNVNDRLAQSRHENDKMFKKIQELEGKYSKSSNRLRTLTDLTNIDLDIDIDELGLNELKEYCLDLKGRFEKAILEIRAVKKQLRDSYEVVDKLETMNHGLEQCIDIMKQESQAEITLMVARLDHLTAKLNAAEKQLKFKAKTESRDKRRSLSLKGRESFSINKEVEDKVTELEAKIVALERGRTRRKFKRDRSSERSSPIDDKALRRLRRKSLDSATSSEQMKLLMRLSSLETKVTNVNASTESLNLISFNNSMSDLTKCIEESGGEHEIEPSDISVAKRKITDCLNQINLLKNRNRRALSPTLDRLTMLEQNLNELNDILSARSSISDEEIEVIKSSASAAVSQLQSLLIEKLTNLAEKKRLLEENNKLDKTTRLEILAEKVAYENILISKIKEALSSPANGDTVCERLVHREIRETAYLMNSLQCKLNGTSQPVMPVCHMGAEHLTKILSNCLIAASQGSEGCKNLLANSNTPSLNILHDEQKKLNILLIAYKNSKLPQLAEALAIETISLSSDKVCRHNTLDEDTINEFNRAARQKVNEELIRNEINHILLRAAQMYKKNFDNDNQFFFSFFAAERAALELFSDSVRDALYDEIECSIEELTESYKNYLHKLQRQNWRRRVESERLGCTPKALLNEFADIIAHKALIDARINVLSNENNSECVNSVKFDSLSKWLENDKYWTCLDSHSLVQINQSLEAEFNCMVDKYSRECRNLIGLQPEVEVVVDCLNEIAEKVADLQKFADVPVDENVMAAEDWDEVCKKCRSLRDQLEEVRYALQTRTPKINHPLEEPRLVHLGTEYLTQVENLRAAYRCALESCKERHQEVDIEHLQDLCERVLVAIEQWHRRTIQDLREAHAQEMEALKNDKEQALAEETQATLAALDAMRKAHEAEVQREVARFKQEFARHQRDDIMDLSEKLSVKCLEAAALEEQLSSATRQLAHAQQHILQLERNPQLSLQN